jgi:hypothetical protein
MTTALALPPALPLGKGNYAVDCPEDCPDAPAEVWELATLEEARAFARVAASLHGCAFQILRITHREKGDGIDETDGMLTHTEFVEEAVPPARPSRP